MPLTTDDCKSIKTYEVVFSCRDTVTDTPYVVCRPFSVSQGDERRDDASDDLTCMAVSVWGDDASDKTAICTPTAMDEGVRDEVLRAFHGHAISSQT